MRIITSILFLTISLNAHSNIKQITCSGIYQNKGETIESVTQYVFDTDDFVKDSPTYEYTLIRYDLNGSPKREHISQLGETYRYPMTVSPSTLSFDSCSNVKNLGTSCIFKDMGISLMSTIHISRKDLSVTGGKKGDYMCEIKDYQRENII